MNEANHSVVPPGMVAAAEQGYHHFLDGLANATAEVGQLVEDMGPVYAFAYLTVRLRLEDPDVRAGLAAIAMVRLAQMGGTARLTVARLGDLLPTDGAASRRWPPAGP